MKHVPTENPIINYYQEFINLMGENIEAIIQNSPECKEAQIALQQIYSQHKKDSKPNINPEHFDQKVSNGLIKNNELWFNMGYSAGWNAGAIVILKILGLDKPSPQEIITNMNPSQHIN